MIYKNKIFGAVESFSIRCCTVNHPGWDMTKNVFWRTYINTHYSFQQTQKEAKQL